MASASGTSAIFNTIINIARVGDEVVSASNLYGGTYTMFSAILPNLGITTNWADIHNIHTFEKAITAKTRLIYVETIGNPKLDVADLDAISDIAKKYHLPLVVDATFTTPCLLQTVRHGANIIINSLTKWMGGQGTAIGGITTDTGNFDWSDPKFSLYTQPDSSYHGLRWALDVPPESQKIVFAQRFRTVPLRNLGACISPDNAWVFVQGLETLPLRMPRHSENALAVARFLSTHSKVAWVRHPALPGDPSYFRAQKYLKNGGGGMVVFGIKKGKEGGVKFIDNLKLFSLLANVGDSKSLAIHPASTTHSQLSEAEQNAAGVSPDLIRLSIGIEYIDDIIQDIESALEKV